MHNRLIVNGLIKFWGDEMNSKYEPLSVEVLLMNYHRMHHHVLQYQMNKRGLQIGHPMLLLFLSRLDEQNETVNLKFLADHMGVSPAAVTNSLKSLERLSLIQKYEDENDLRCKCIKITPKGKMAVSQCHEIFDLVNQGLFQDFSEEEKKELAGYLLRLCKNLSKMGANTPDSILKNQLTNLNKYQ